MTAARRTVPIVGLAALAWVLADAWDPWSQPRISDVPVYQTYAHAMAGGAIPYRDFAFEYPPGAAVPMALARLIPMDYRRGFSLLMFVALVATVLGVMACAQALVMRDRRIVGAGVAVALTPIVLGDLVSTRFDLVLTALLAWTLWAAITQRFRTMWLLLALAVLVKLVPIVLVPVLVVWQRRCTGRLPVRDVALGAAAVLAGFAPFVAVGASGVGRMLRLLAERPLQLESMGGSYLLALRGLAGIPIGVRTSYGSQNVAGRGVDVVTAFTTGLQVAVLIAVVVAFITTLRTATGPVAPHAMVAAVATTMAAFVATGKVLSPQFMVWLLAAGLLVIGPYGQVAFAATVSTMLATQLYFPGRYWGLVTMQDAPIALLVIRNALLVIVVAACWPRSWWTWGRAAPASVTLPG